MTQEALKLALESMKRIDAWLIQRGYTGLMPQEKEAIAVIEKALAQEQEPVALQDDEIYDAAFSAYCRGENSRELFRIMWSNRLACSIGWDRDELKSFARNIAALYTTPPQRPRVVFPTMLRKMWSGSEVQAWLDENVNKENT